jgi:hypothetical protein
VPWRANTQLARWACAPLLIDTFPADMRARDALRVQTPDAVFDFADLRDAA